MAAFMCTLLSLGKGVGLFELLMIVGERGGFQLRDSNLEKQGDHRKKKFFVNDSVKALILCNEKRQGLLKLHVPFWGASSEGGLGLSPKKGIFFRTEKKCQEVSWGLLKSCLSSEVGLEGCHKEKWGGNRKGGGGWCYSKMLGSALWGRLAKTLQGCPCVTVLWTLSLLAGIGLHMGCKGGSGYCYHF